MSSPRPPPALLILFLERLVEAGFALRPARGLCAFLRDASTASAQLCGIRGLPTLGLPFQYRKQPAASMQEVGLLQARVSAPDLPVRAKVHRFEVVGNRFRTSHFAFSPYRTHPAPAPDTTPEPQVGHRLPPWFLKGMPQNAEESLAFQGAQPWPGSDCPPC